MTLDEFDAAYVGFKSSDKIGIMCDNPDHPAHIPRERKIGKQAARRNILKRGGESFICRDCHMKFNNPMNQKSESRQTDEVIVVSCPDPDHVGPREREMKKACYYNSLTQPYSQICGSCAQRGKTIQQEQRDKISESLAGRTLSPEHRDNILRYRENNPEWADKASKNLIPGMGGIARKGIPLRDDWKQAISDGTKGKNKSEDHKKAISRGRKEWFQRVGGFTKEHRERISEATIRQYGTGFDPQLHHRRGWYTSTKSGRVFYRSSYERRAFEKLTADSNVLAFDVEVVTIKYFHPVKNIRSSYIVDLLVQHVDGSKMLLEIKPINLVLTEINQAKGEAALRYAKKRGWDYRVWTEVDLFDSEKELRDYVANIPKQGETDGKASER